jgi:23S rRNA pseudouridine1911/1915/1917 synthase
MSIFETKSGDKSLKLHTLLESYFIQNKITDSLINDYAVYINDRLSKDMNKVIRPRSKIVFFNKNLQKPKIEIVFENKELIVLNKPEGLPTQKTLKTHEDNLYDQVRLYYFLDKNIPQGVPYVGLHHRLDRMTSGLVLMTKMRSVNKEVADLFKNKKITKTYSAYCQWGLKKPQQKWLEKNLISRGQNKKHPFYFTVSKKGDEAITQFELIESKESCWHHFKCLPLTGRTHQLRVQLANLGFPIIGDPVYGKAEKGQRLMLHAEELQFTFKGQKVLVEAKPRWSVPSQT